MERLRSISQAGGNRKGSNTARSLNRKAEEERAEEIRKLQQARMVASREVDGHEFRAELDLTELDDRNRPGPTWTAKAIALSRSTLWFNSRRMCYEGRGLLVAVHLIDSEAAALYGLVAWSDYDGEGLYRTRLDLKELPKSDPVKHWVEDHRRGRL